VCVGAFEADDACRAWKEEYQLDFPVVPDDEHNTLFRALSNGWVPWSVLVAPDGEIVFSENEFDETGFANAIQRLYDQPGPQIPERAKEPAHREAAAEPQTIVVLGGGTGGVVVAHELRRHLASKHRVVVLDRSPDHVYQSSLLWQIVGERRDDEIRRPLSRLSKKGIEFQNVEVEGLELDRKVVRTSSGDLSYDYLIVSLGSHLVPETVPGFNDMALNLYDPRGCQQIHEAVEQFTGGTIGIVITAMPFKCPAAPYEAAFLLESFFRKKGIRRDVEIHLFTPEHTPMPIAPAALGDAIADMLAARGIHYHPLYTFAELRPETREVVASDGRTDHVDLLIGIPPHQAPDVVRASPLLGTSGFFHVDAGTLRTEYDGVFAIGDVTTVKLPNGKALPKAGVFAHFEAVVVAKQIVAAVSGKESHAEFDGRGYCWIELGDGRAGFAGGNFYTEPDPQVKMRRPGRLLHWGKIAFEKWWLTRWF
jgi:sulfide:quinone oxidoreductase